MARSAAARAGDDGFVDFAARHLFIRDKTGGIVPLKLNAVQRLVHARIVDQRARTGRVRMLVLKARQPGVSTYVEGRFYWLVIRNKGVRAFILTHLRDATEAIFGMVERFHDRNPAEDKPHVGASNAKELYFDETDSGYRVGTAGSRAIGRGYTVQFFHGSEVAHWPNGGAFPAVAHENALDKLTMMVQELSGRLTRSLRFPVSDPVSLSAVTPNAESRANRYLAFDANGAPVATAGPAGDSSVPVSPFMETMLDDPDAATARATLQAAGTGDINSFTKIQKWAKGADVSSANALTLGTDGNYFDITGTNTITSIGTVGVGTVVRLHFTAALTLTHHATDLIMPNAENVVTVAGDEFEFIEYASGDWICTHQPQRLASTTFKGVVEKATQEEMQTPTADKYPDAQLVSQHPGVPKLVVRLTDLATTPNTSFLHNLLGSLSVTDGGTGVYTLNWTNTLNTPRVTAQLINATSGTFFAETGVPTGTSVVIRAFTSAGAAVDPTAIEVVVWGNLA